ncbi:RNA polymerase sigma factor [Actinocorallia lasiicapitis]
MLEAPPDTDFGAIFDRHFPEIHRYAAQRLDAATADDVAAETFTIAFRKRHAFDPDLGPWRPWLYGIATKLIGRHRRDEARKLAALQRLPFAEDPGHADRVADQVSAGSLRGPLAAAIAALPQGQRDVLLLIALADLSYDEVATALKIRPGTVASRFNRARTALRSSLGALAKET